VDQVRGRGGGAGDGSETAGEAVDPRWKGRAKSLHESVVGGARLTHTVPTPTIRLGRGNGYAHIGSLCLGLCTHCDPIACR
jgi:hypothetical protein